MDVAADIAQLPGIAPGEAISGGITRGDSDACLLYRYTAQLLEVRGMATPALGTPEALATLTTAQLQVDSVEDLEISLVAPVTLDGETHLLVFVREALAKAARLVTFNPFTLSIGTIATPVPYAATSLSVSAPLRAGQGSSTEWDFAVVCFGLPGGQLVLGNLTIDDSASQLTALKKQRLDTHQCDIVSSCMVERPDSRGRVLVFLGLESGHVTVLEYDPFNSSRSTPAYTLSEGADCGPVSRVAASALGGNHVALCVGHGTGNRSRSSPTAAVFLVALDPAQAPGSDITISHLGTEQMQPPSIGGDDDGDDEDEEQELMAALLESASIVDLSVLASRGDTQPEDVPGTVLVAALAATWPSANQNRRKSRIRSGRGLPGSSDAETTHGIFNAWVFDAQASKLEIVSCQEMSAAVPVIGMRISGEIFQLEVATARHLLVGDALAGGASGNDAAEQSGIGLPLSIGEYLSADEEFTYKPLVRQAITEQRRCMDGELFIDLLLRMASVEDQAASNVYPPRTPAARDTLVEQIGSSELDDLKQRCIAYYLLLDASAMPPLSAHGTYMALAYDLPAGDGPAARYASSVQIPRHFVYLMRGYWLLDHAQAASAIPYLADPSVIADWPSKILTAAVDGGYYTEAMQFLSSATALVPPRLDEQLPEAPLVMEVLLRCDFSRAFMFQRQAESVPELRQALLAQLFSFALSPTSRRTTVDRLATLPFDTAEEAALAAYCTDPEAPVHAQDFLALHYVNCGRYAEAIRLFRAIAKEEDGQSLTGAQKKKRDERLAMVRNLMMLLPEAQRGVVEELESINEGHGGALDAEAADAEVTEEDEVEEGRGLTHATRSDLSRMRSMDADDMSYAGEHSDAETIKASDRAPATPIRALLTNLPLSASKSSRQQRSVVSASGAPQSPSHPLLRVLVRQMAVEKPHPARKSRPAVSFGTGAGTQPARSSLLATKIEGASEAGAPATPKAKAGSTPQRTPWKTPKSVASGQESQGPSAQQTTPLSHGMRSPHSGLLRVPFSGPPSTPRRTEKPEPKPANLVDAGQTPGRGLLSHVPELETPVAIKRVPGSFPEPSSSSRSPFEKARQSSAAAANSKQANDKTKTAAKPTKAPQHVGDGSPTQRYNLRTRTSPEKPTASTSSEKAAGAENRDVEQAPSTKTKGKQRTSRPKPSRASRKTSSDEANGKSVRRHERSVGRSAEILPKQGSRSRKRPHQHP
ncbi:hypothetical protein GGF46_001935 [Coemansia sp. RSA 552]|nr:hypothetical protein GGF46_001935 [Coemansia sp. RSA 552]